MNLLRGSSCLSRSFRIFNSSVRITATSQNFSTQKDPVLIVGAGTVGQVLGKCLENDGVQYEIIKTANEALLEATPYDVLNRNAIDVFRKIGLWDEIEKVAHPISDMQFEIAPRKKHKPSKLLANIPLTNYDKEYPYSAYSVSNIKLRRILGENISGKRINLIKPHDDGVAVVFKGGATIKYSTVVMTDGAWNAYLYQFKKRRPAQYLHEMASVIIQRNEFDPNSLIDLFVHGMRITILPISSTELQVTFHREVETTPTTKLISPVDTLIKSFNLDKREDLTDISSFESVIQRILELPAKQTAHFSNPRYFKVPLPRENGGKLLAFPCRRQSNDVAGLGHSYSIEECYLLSKAIACNSSAQDMAKDLNKNCSAKEKQILQFCNKVIKSSVYPDQLRAQGNSIVYLMRYLRSIMSHQMFGRYKSRYYAATKPLK